MIGISMGGIETWLAGAVDDRVKVAVPAISVQSFRWSLDNDALAGPRQHDQGGPRRRGEGPGRAGGQRPGLPGPLGQGHPRHPRPVRLPEHAPPLRRPPAADPQRREGPELPDRRRPRRHRLRRGAPTTRPGPPDQLKVMVAEGVGHAVTARAARRGPRLVRPLAQALILRRRPPRPHAPRGDEEADRARRSRLVVALDRADPDVPVRDRVAVVLEDDRPGRLVGLVLGRMPR